MICEVGQWLPVGFIPRIGRFDSGPRYFPERPTMGLILYEYQCEKCGAIVESLEDSGTKAIKHCQTSIASRIISAVFGKVKDGAISQGKRHTHDRPDWCLNTEKLADGQDPTEWREEETKRLTGRSRSATMDELKERGASYEIRKS